MEAIGTKAWFCAADMRDQAAVQAAVAAADRFGGIDILVQNAGMYPEQPIEQMTSDDWDLVHHTNLRGTFFAVQACIPAMRARGGGRIVLVSSITGVRTGFPGLAHYGATKAGMNGFMRSAALELAPYGITINAVEPGSIRTEGLAALGAPAIAAMEECIPAAAAGPASGDRYHGPVPGLGPRLLHHRPVHRGGRGADAARDQAVTAA